MKNIKSFVVVFFTLILGACGANYQTEDNIYYAIGDSITWLDGEEFSKTDTQAVGYPSLVKELEGFDVAINKGISGASLADNDSKSNGSILLDNKWGDLKYADTITVFAGTNDFRLDVPLGKISENDFDNATFIGAYQTLLNKIHDEAPNATVYLITPLQRDKDGYDTKSVNGAGNKLIDYVNAVKEIGNEYNLQIIDLYNKSEINIDTLEKYTVDGLHPNNEGFKILADEISQTIK